MRRIYREIKMAVRIIKTISLAVSLVLLAGSLAGLMAACSLLDTGDRGLVINEVVTSNTNSLSVSGLGSPDWIEIYNGSGNDINMGGYVLRSSKKPSAYYIFPNIVLKADDYLVIYACSKPEDEELWAFCTDFNLSRDGVGLVLLNSSLRVVDEVEVPALKRDISWCRTPEGFKYCSTTTPGYKNSGIMADSIDELEMISAAPGLRLNEATRDWVEIYNGSQEAVNLASYCLSDNASSLTKWRFPNVEILPGQYMVIGLNRDIGDHRASFGISDTEEAVYFSIESRLIGSLVVKDLYDSMSVGLDQNGDIAYFPDLTPGQANSDICLYSLDISPMTEADPVRISEVLLKNTTSLMDEFGDRSPWVELHNYSDRAIDLSYYYLSDNPYDLDKWRLPDKKLGPGEYLVIFLSGRDTGLHTGFRVAAGEPVILTDFSALRTQTIEIPDESRLDNISYGEQDGEWLYFGQPTPNSANTSHGHKSISSVERLSRTGMFISEVSAVSMPRASANRAEDRDWIELYNSGDKEVDLTGWHIGKDLDDPFMCKLTGTIGARSYKVFYARAGSREKDTLQMNISMAGDLLVLSNASNEIVDVFYTGALRYGLTSGRARDDYSGQRYFFTKPTPMAANSKPVTTYSAAPVFSHKGGFYTKSFTLEIEGKNVYYTTDGSTPTEDSIPYTGPIRITKNTVVSAVSLEPGKLPSDKVVATFLFEEPHKIPVVCLSAKPSDIDEVNADLKKSAPIVERLCHIEYYEPDGKLGTSFPAGFRLAGASTRIYPQKSYNIYLRGGYGQSSVIYPFFEDYDITEFKSLTLRNGGQDNDDSTSTFITDAFCSMLGKKFNSDYAETRYVVVYINGQYRGVYELKENSNEDMFAARHGVDPDDISIIRRNSSVLQGSNKRILWAQEYAQTYDLNDPGHYEEFAKYVDVDAFIDHIFLQAYTGNADTFNQKYWYTNDNTVKIRPIWFDLDYGYFNANVIWHYFSGKGIQTGDGSFTNMWITTGLKMNDGWREKLYDRWAYHLTHTVEDRLEIFDRLYAQLEPEMQRHCSYWMIYSYTTWKGNVEKLRNRIAGRNEVFKSQMQRYFGLSDDKMEEIFSKYQ
mgnify:CR=1 FL=1